MQLIGGLGSPFVRKVRVALAELGMTDQVELVPSGGKPGTLNQEISGKNPVGKIPAFIMKDGGALFDSRMIMRYVNDLAGGELYPAGDWDMVRRESQAEGMLDAGLLLRFETFARPEEFRWSGWIDGQSVKVNQCLDAMEKDAAALARVDAAPARLWPHGMKPSANARRWPQPAPQHLTQPKPLKTDRSKFR